MNLVFNFPLDHELIRFNVPKDTLGIRVDFKSEEVSGYNFFIYDDTILLRGQNFGYGKKGSMWLGPEKALSSDYCLPHTGSKYYEITNMVSSDFPNSKTLGKITFYSNRKEYIEDFIEENYITPSHRWIYDDGYYKYNFNTVPASRAKERDKWFSGDFHTHTIFSDGQESRENNIETAKRYKVDFFFATDHLIFPLSWPKTDDVLVLPSTEITTIHGHFNLYFGKSPYGRKIHKDQTIEANVIELLENSEGLLSINHPFRRPHDMTLDGLDLTKVRMIEVMNTPYNPKSAKPMDDALKAWSRSWNMGHDFIGLAGSDSHKKLGFRHKESDELERLGNPLNYIFAHELSWNSLKEGVEKKALAFSSHGRPGLTFTENPINGDLAGRSAIGVKVDLDQVELEFKLEGCQRDDLVYEWIVDGNIKYIEYRPKSVKTLTREDGAWLRVDIRDKKRTLVGSLNPLRIKESKKIGRVWKDLMSENKAVKALIFDKDGTLIEFTDIWGRATADYVENLDISDEEKAKGKYAAGICEDGSIWPGSPLASGTIGQIAEAINGVVSPQVEEANLIEKYAEYIDLYPDTFVARGDLVRIFKEAKDKGMLLGVVTSDDQKLSIKQFQAMGIDRYFDFIYGGDQLEPKPSPAILKDISEKYDIGMDEMVYVGDSLADMKFGSYTQKAIAIASTVSDENQLRDLSDVYIEKLEEVLDHI